MPYTTKDYTGAGFEYVVDKKFRPALCFGSKLPRAVMPSTGAGLTGFMRRAGAGAGTGVPPHSRGITTCAPPPHRPVKMLTIPKNPRWVEVKGYQPPPRAASPRPPRKRGPHVPFNSSTKQSPKPVDKRIPGPGTYNPSNKKRQMKFNHSFGGMKIVVPAVDVKCVPYNHDACAICSVGCSEQGDYWHQYNKVFLCRACFERQYITHSRYNILQLEEFQGARDMSNLGNTIGQPQSIAPHTGTMNQQSSAIQYPTGTSLNQKTTDNQSAVTMQASPSQHSPMSSQSQSAGKSSVSNADQPAQIVTRPRLQELVREVDPTEQLDEEVEELLLQLADDFIDSTMNAACLLAKHRHVPTVEVKDVQLHLERNWNMWIPGFGTDELRPYKRATVTEAHKQRMALIRKAIKKY